MQVANATLIQNGDDNKMYEQLKHEMARQSIKAYSLAKEAEISTSDLYSALRGERPMYPNWRKRIAAALGKSEEELFYVKGEEE